MATLGTFDSFTTMRLGIYAAQHGLHITGNNISNINTIGYTRQRVDQVSFKTGATDRYASWADNHMGSGVLVSGISQIRDPFLDIRYRTTCTDTYYYDTKLASLQSIASILDEVGKGDNDGDGLIYAQFQDLLTQLRAFSADPTSAYDTLVRNSAEALCSLFRTYAGKLDELYDNTETDFYNNIDKVNEILTNIRDLNEAIRDAEIHGDQALETRDERNRQIDALSQYISIRVEYSYEDVGAGVQVEKLTIKMGNSNPDKNVHTDESILVDGLYCTQLSVPDQKPVLNTYDNEYLQGYLYLKQVSADSDEVQALLDAGYKLTDLIQATDADGNVIPGVYYVGTNDAADEGIVTEKNDNYTVQLGQLLDRKGNVWKNTTTKWETIDGLRELSNATYTYTVTMGNGHPMANDKFVIKGDPDTTYTVGDGDVPTDAGALLTFIADKLNESGRYPDYTVSASGGKLIFTANNEGQVGVDADAPAAKPDLSLENSEDAWFSLGGRVEEDPGYYTVAPDAGYTETDEFGTTTTVKYIQSGDQWYKLTVVTEHTREIALDDNDLHGILQAQREMLTEEGEFASAKDVAIDENACIKRGIPYYIKSLDLLAQKFAEAYNELNQGYMQDKDGYYIDAEGNRLVLAEVDGTESYVSSGGLTAGQLENLLNNGYFLTDEDGNLVDKYGYLITDDDGNPITVDDDGNLAPEYYDKAVVDLDRWLEENGGVFMGGVLFSNSNDGNEVTDPPINAHNIDISAGWSNGAWGIVPKFETLFVDAENPDGLEHSTQNKNADHMVSLLQDKALTYDPRDLHGSDAIGPQLFEGTFNDMLSNMMAVEAKDESITTVELTTSSVMLTELDYSREGVSGVDLNDEAMNMITYQKAMNAAMRLMTAIDEALERLINNTGVAGR